MKSFPFLLSFLLLSGALRAAPASLDALVAEILTENPELAFYTAELDAARAGQRIAAAPNDPALSVSAGRKRVHDPAGLLAGEGTAWSVSLAQTFEWPGRIALRKSLANRQLALAELGLDRFRATLAARARALGYGWLAAQEKAAAAAEVAARYQALRELFLQRDPAGLTPLLETRVIEAHELALQRRAGDAGLAAAAALAELNQLRGAPPDAPLPDLASAGRLTFGSAPATSALLTAARENNFEYRAASLELAQQGDAVSLARHERRPSITVAPFLSQENAGDRETVVGLGLTIPIPISARGTAATATAEARRRQAAAALAVAQRQLERDVVSTAQAFAVKTAAIARWAPDATTKFREAAELADRHYRLGAVPLATYVELQAAYLDAVEALCDTQREALESGLRLEFITGLSFNAVTTEAAR